MDGITRANLSAYVDADSVNDYLSLPYHARRIRQAADLLLRETRRRVGAPRVADLGAGSDAVSTMLRRRGARVVMVDARAAGLRSPCAPSPGAAPIPLIQADLSCPLPLRDCALDGLFAGEIIEHLFDPAAFLLECRRVLVTGGVLVVTTPNLATLADRLRFLAGRSPRQINASHPYLRLHIRPFTRSSLVRLFRECGFTPVGFRSNYWVLGGDRRAVYSRLLARLLPSLGGSLILAGVKDAGQPGPARAAHGGAHA